MEAINEPVNQKEDEAETETATPSLKLRRARKQKQEEKEGLTSQPNTPTRQDDER